MLLLQQLLLDKQSISSLLLREQLKAFCLSISH